MFPRSCWISANKKASNSNSRNTTALRQRITMNYNMDGYSKDESKEYILTKLRGVRCARQVFDENALEALANAANGVPRLLNKLANSCLMIASAKNSDIIDSEIVMQAVTDCELV